jgi:hypothetical protein
MAGQFSGYLRSAGMKSSKPTNVWVIMSDNRIRDLAIVS